MSKKVVQIIAKAGLAKMAVYGKTSEKLVAGEALVNEAEDALKSEKTEMVKAQEATRLWDEAVDTLQNH